MIVGVVFLQKCNQNLNKKIKLWQKIRQNLLRLAIVTFSFDSEISNQNFDRVKKISLEDST